MTTLSLADYHRDRALEPDLRIGISQRQYDLIAALQIAYSPIEAAEDNRDRPAGTQD